MCVSACPIFFFLILFDFVQTSPTSERSLKWGDTCAGCVPLQNHGMYHSHHLVTCDERECDSEWRYSRWRLFGAFGVVTRRFWDDSDVPKPFFLHSFPCNANNHPQWFQSEYLNCVDCWKWQEFIDPFLVSPPITARCIRRSSSDEGQSLLAYASLPGLWMERRKRLKTNKQKKPSAEDFSCFFFLLLFESGRGLTALTVFW